MQISSTSMPLIPAILSKYFAGNDDGEKKLLAHIFLAAIGSLLLTISAKVQVPFYPVPMTMQTLVVLMIGMSYGASLGSGTILLCIAYITGPTGGYIVGFLISATLLGLLANKGWGKTWKTTAFAMIMGVCVIFLSGVGWLSLFVGFEVAVLKGFLPFVFADFLKIVIACFAMPAAWYCVDKIKK